MCYSHFSWYCFISFTIFSAPVFPLIHWFFLYLVLLCTAVKRFSKAHSFVSGVTAPQWARTSSFTRCLDDDAPQSVGTSTLSSASAQHAGCRVSAPHTSVPRPPGKDPVPIVQEAGWAPGPIWTGAENLAPPPGFGTRTVQPAASRYID